MDQGQTRQDSADLAHDVLAAEEFALPTADPRIGHPPVALPDDPSGIAEPHDVLAAEEFALPASAAHLGGAAVPPRPGPGRVVVAAGVAVVVLLRSVARRAARSRRGS